MAIQDNINPNADLEEIELEVENIKEEMANLGGALINTATGSPILLTDSAAGKVIDFKTYGRSKQKQYSGKNLLIYPYFNKTHTEYGITWTDFGDGTIGVSAGTTTGACYFIFRHNIAGDTVYQILPKGTYTVNGGTSKIALRVFKIDENGEVATSILAFDNGNGATFELTEETRLNIQLRIEAGATIDETVIKPMIRPASIIDSTYEPYVGGVASPNPDYPQDIESVAEGCILEIKSKGNNLLKNNINNQTLYGVTFTKNDDASISVSGTSISEFSITINENLELSKGVYIINGNLYNDNVTRLGVRVNEQWFFDYGSGKEFAVQEDTYAKVSMVFKQGCTFNATIYPMIRPKGTDDIYKPYKEKATYITLNEPIRSSLDESVRDVARLNEINRKFTETTYNGDENFSKVNEFTNTIMFQIKPNNIKNAGNIASPILTCSHFVNRAIYNNDIEGIQNSNGYIYIRINKTRLSSNDLTGFKSWLQANPITVQYELAEPIVEKIESVAVTTYDSTTNIVATDNANMEITYFTQSGAPIINMFNEIETEIADLKTEIADLKTEIAAPDPDSGWIPLLVDAATDEYSGANVEYKKKDGVLYLKGKIDILNASEMSYTLGTLPAEFIPDTSQASYSFPAVGCAYNGSNTNSHDVGFIYGNLITKTGLLRLDFAYSVDCTLRDVVFNVAIPM